MQGRVEMRRYDTGYHLQEAGVISGYDITSEAAITKMMFLFGMRYSSSMVKKYMVSDICGELTLP
jgi:L-asparaginase